MSDNNSSTGSILDRVIMSQQADTLEHYNPLEIVNELLKQVSEKEADVVRRRFGLGSNPAETLEIIGQSYQVTRERIRQIQRWTVQRLAKQTTTKNILRSVTALIQSLLDEHGGVMIEEELLTSLHTNVTDSSAVRAATMFILEELMTDKFQRISNEHHRSYWKSKYATIDLLAPTIATAEQVLRDSGRPLPQAKFFELFRKTTLAAEHGPQLGDGVVLSYLAVDKNIDRNPFGEIGLREWGSVVPKRMNDKILMVLKKQGQPMHFQDITKRINEIGFDHRKAYAPTVHNELILNPEYVLIGRGIYALKEWGYKPGVVADVLAAILKDHGQPMTRDELVGQVLSQRMVKKNTIHLALTNKKLFSRLDDGRYTLNINTSNTGPS